MKLIIRADDVGYTDVHNMGTWKTIEEGVTTAADVMLDTPGTVDALTRLREYPWISVGWHSHFWGSPVLPATKVSTLIAENGHFRHDLTTADDVSYDESLKELRAELFRCVDILGHAPGYREFVYPEHTPFGRAMAQVTEEFGIATKYMKNDMPVPADLKPPEGIAVAGSEVPQVLLGAEVDEKWANRKIFYAGLGGSASMTDSISDAYNYDPLSSFLAGAPKLLARPSDQTFFSAWHPGYVDHYVFKEGDCGIGAKNFILCRAVDVEALCDKKFKDWIIENHVELVNFHDALWGTRDYQNHLRQIGSPLACDRFTG